MADSLLILIDGSSYLYRAYHALPPLNAPDGRPTGAVFGVASMLKRLQLERPGARVVVVFDARGRTFRDDIFKEYKAHRPPMPEDLSAQVEPLLDLVRAMGLPLLQVPGVEADDVIGTLATRAHARGEPVLISTGDKDMAQLVVPGITLINTMSNTSLDREGVKAKFDVWPEQMVDYLALCGDASDNIPGVPKVGPKTAAKWLGQYGTLDALIADAANVPGKVGESLRASLEVLALSKDLARIRCDLDLPSEADALDARPPDTTRLIALCTQLGFNRWRSELESGMLRAEAGTQPTPTSVPPPAPTSPAIPPPVARHYETILDAAALTRWLDKLQQAPLFAVDTETTDLDYMQAEIVGLSFAVTAGEAAYLPLHHHYLGVPAQLDRTATLALLKPLLEDLRPRKVGHHLKYDAHVLLNHGIALQGIAHDTLLESYALDAGGRHDMDTLAEKHLGVRTISFEDVAGKGAKQRRFDEVEIERATEYAAEDADITLQLHQALWPRLEGEPVLRRVYETLDLPLARVLLGMEHHGVLVDTVALLNMSTEFAGEMARLEREAHALAGGEFNLSSPKQLGEILFEKQGLPVVRKTPTGQPSTAEDVLEELAADYALPRAILDYRSVQKLKSTYTDKLPTMVHPRTGRVHTSYHQAAVVTGRLSSSDPNLQNIPIRTAAGRRIRQAFIAPPGMLLLAADYSQIELRIMAHLSGDAGLLEAFAADRDVHQATAAEVFGVPLDEVSGDQRRSAKAINFGLIYGMSAFGLAKQLGIGRTEAQAYVDKYFARYPGVKRYMDEIRESARATGYVETVFGRRMTITNIDSRNQQLRQGAERAAINAPMQGTAADIIRQAMVDLDAWLTSSGAPARMLMQVHDELVFEVEAAAAGDLRDAVRARMSAAAELRVPLKVDVGIGANWDEAH
jgi:DNA polymerase-1